MGIISDYFSPDSTLYPGSGLTFYVFDYSKVGSFVQDCLIPFREAYIAGDKPYCFKVSSDQKRSYLKEIAKER